MSEMIVSKCDLFVCRWLLNEVGNFPMGKGDLFKIEELLKMTEVIYGVVR